MGGNAYVSNVLFADVQKLLGKSIPVGCKVFPCRKAVVRRVPRIFVRAPRLFDLLPFSRLPVVRGVRVVCFQRPRRAPSSVRRTRPDRVRSAKTRKRGTGGRLNPVIGQRQRKSVNKFPPLGLVRVPPRVGTLYHSMRKGM